MFLGTIKHSLTYCPASEKGFQSALIFVVLNCQVVEWVDYMSEKLFLGNKFNQHAAESLLTFSL